MDSKRATYVSTIDNMPNMSGIEKASVLLTYCKAEGSAKSFAKKILALKKANKVLLDFDEQDFTQRELENSKRVIFRITKNGDMSFKFETTSELFVWERKWLQQDVTNQ